MKYGIQFENKLQKISKFINPTWRAIQWSSDAQWACKNFVDTIRKSVCEQPNMGLSSYKSDVSEITKIHFLHKTFKMQ